MAIPNYQDLMLLTLKAAKTERKFKDVVEDISQTLGLTDDEKRQTISSGTQPLIYNRVGWAKFYLVKAGLLKSPKRGFFIITKNGNDVLKNPPVKIDNNFLKQFDEFNDFVNSKKQNVENGQKQIDDVEDADDLTPDEMIVKAHSEINRQLKAEILEKLKQVDPIFFEKVVLNLMLEMGYGADKLTSAKMTQKSNDGGIDGIINEDTLGLDKIYLQAKRYSSQTVSRESIQAFVGALAGEGASKGVFITTSQFSKYALEYANNQKIILIDGEALAEYMLKYNVGVIPHRKIEMPIHMRSATGE